jgi:hypothetical protein
MKQVFAWTCKQVYREPRQFANILLFPNLSSRGSDTDSCDANLPNVYGSAIYLALYETFKGFDASCFFDIDNKQALNESAILDLEAGLKLPSMQPWRRTLLFCLSELGHHGFMSRKRESLKLTQRMCRPFIFSLQSEKIGHTPVQWAAHGTLQKSSRWCSYLLNMRVWHPCGSTQRRGAGCSC